MLAEKIKQLADQMVDKRATVQSVADHVGPWKNDEGNPLCDLTPRDKDFQAGDIGIGSDHGDPLLPISARRPAYLELTLSGNTNLTADSLKPVFGKWRKSPGSPEGNPYSVVFYYPDDKALLSVAVFAYLSGPVEDASTRVMSVMLRRDDIAEVMRERH